MAEKTQSENNETGNLEMPEMPEHWKMLPIEQWVNEGGRVRIKSVHGNEYIIIRNSKIEKSLGRYSQENWDLLHELFPKLRGEIGENVPQETVPEHEQIVPTAKDVPTVQTTEMRHVPRSNKPGSGYLNVALKQPPVFPKNYTPSLKIVRFYEVYRNEGGTSEFSTFINDIVETHLRKCHGYMIDLLPIKLIEEA